ncbi:MAG: GumC family protein [Rhizobiaceae bacterium]
MSGAEILIQDDDIDVAGVFSALKRRWWLIALITLLTGLGLFFFLSSLDPKYGSGARILIKDGNTAFTRATSEGTSQDSRNRLDEQAVRSEVEIANSDNIALQVIDELDLTKNSELSGSNGNSGFLNLVFAMLGQEPEPVEETRNKVLAKFKERMTVYAVEQSRVIVVEFWAHDPNLAQDIVAALSENYINFKNSERQNSQATATSWLDPRIAELEAAVNEKEAAVADFRASEDLLRSNDNNALLATQQLSQISTELSRLKAQRSSAQAKVASIRNALDSGIPLEVIPEVIESNLIQRLREREVALRSQISELSVTLLPNHPRMKSLNSQLGNLERQIRNAANNVVASLEGNVASIREAEADLAKEIVRLKSEAARVDEKLVELRAREREAETARTLLTEYRSRSLEAKSRAGLSQTDAEIISPASLAVKPYFPKVVPFTLAGMVSALLLTALGVIAGNLLTTTRHSHHQVPPVMEREEPDIDNLQVSSDNSGNDSEEALSVAANELPLQGYNSEESVPTAPTLNMNEQVRNPDALAVRYAATAITDLESARIAVISPAGSIGAETSSILARHLASKNRPTIIIELDQSGSVATEMLGSKDNPGFLNLISGSVAAEHAIFKDTASQAHVIPSGSLFQGQLMPDPETISELVDAISESYDFCILDCGDAEIEEVNIVSTDDTVVVISCNGTSAEDCNAMEAALKADGFEDVLQIQPDAQDAIEGELTAA